MLCALKMEVRKRQVIQTHMALKVKVKHCINYTVGYTVTTISV